MEVIGNRYWVADGHSLEEEEEEEICSTRQWASFGGKEKDL